MLWCSVAGMWDVFLYAVSLVLQYEYADVLDARCFLWRPRRKLTAYGTGASRMHELLQCCPLIECVAEPIFETSADSPNCSAHLNHAPYQPREQTH